MLIFRLLVAPVLALALLPALLLAGPATAIEGKSGYDKATKKFFVSACSQAAQVNGTPKKDAKAICKCTYRGIKKKIPYAEYVAADQLAAQGKPIPTKFLKIRDHCNRKPNSYKN